MSATSEQLKRRAEINLSGARYSKFKVGDPAGVKSARIERLERTLAAHAKGISIYAAIEANNAYDDVGLK